MDEGSEERGGVLEYARPVKRPMGFWQMLLLVAGVLFFISLLIPAFDRRPRTKVGEIKCASNLRQIGQAMFLYSEGNGGAFADFATVMAEEKVGPEVFVCPKGKEQKATGANIAETVADFGLPGRCSYVYVDSGLALGSKPDAILAFEDPASHDLEGMNILYLDGHVDWVTLPYAMAHLNELANGVNPPTAGPMPSDAAAVRKEYERNWRGRMPMLKVRGLRIRAMPEQ